MNSPWDHIKILPLIQQHLWPLLKDAEMAACVQTSKDAYSVYGEYTMKNSITQLQLMRCYGWEGINNRLDVSKKSSIECCTKLSILGMIRHVLKNAVWRGRNRRGHDRGGTVAAAASTTASSSNSGRSCGRTCIPRIMKLTAVRYLSHLNAAVTSSLLCHTTSLEMSVDGADYASQKEDERLVLSLQTCRLPSSLLRLVVIGDVKVEEGFLDQCPFLTDLTMTPLSYSLVNSSSNIRLPPSLRIARLGVDKPTASVEFPATLTTLHLLDYPGHWHQAPSNFVLPPSLIELSLLQWYTHPLPEGLLLSSSLIKLTLDCIHPLMLRDLPALTCLTLSKSFNHPLSGALPPSLRSLRLDPRAGHYNHPIADLPSRLEELILSQGFDQLIIRGSLPPSLTILHFGTSYAHPIAPETLPPSITYLTLGPAFDQLLDVDILPISLNTLVLPWRPMGGWRFITVGVLPVSLTQLTLHRKHPLQCVMLPSSLTVLDMYGPVYNPPLTSVILPANLHTLTLRYDNDSSDQPLRLSDLPTQLQILTIDGINDDNGFPPIAIDVLPRTLTQLTLGAGFNEPIPFLSSLHSLRSLIFGWAFDQPIPPGLLPFSLETLEFGYIFNCKLMPGSLPPSLTRLRFGKYYNHPLDAAGLLPPRLKQLLFSSDSIFAHHLPLSALPPSLEQLNLPVLYRRQTHKHCRVVKDTESSLVWNEWESWEENNFRGASRD